MNVPFNPFQFGECLSQTTFHRRYLKMPNVRAELIEGRVYVAPPRPLQWSRIVTLLNFWLLHYEMDTPGLLTYMRTTIILDNKNEYQPSVCSEIKPEFAGKDLRESITFTNRRS